MRKKNYDSKKKTGSTDKKKLEEAAKVDIDNGEIIAGEGHVLKPREDNDDVTDNLDTQTIGELFDDDDDD